MTRTDRLRLAILVAAARAAFRRSPAGRYIARYGYAPRNLHVSRHRFSYLGVRNAA